MKKLFYIALIVALASCNKKQEAVSDAHSHDDGSHTHDTAQRVPTDTLPSTVIPATANSPEYIQLATNVEVIPDIRSAVKSTGVLTHEGIFGPLLFAESTRAFFIELQPGMFLGEHPHPTESIVYTVSGKWVLCSEGKRQVMEPGSAFHFGSNIPTGWEDPFGEPALLFVVKSKEDGENYENYMKGLLEVKQQMDDERKGGSPFYYNELKADHPAIIYARSVNPNFDEVLKNIKY